MKRRLTTLTILICLGLSSTITPLTAAQETTPPVDATSTPTSVTLPPTATSTLTPTPTVTITPSPEITQEIIGSDTPSPTPTAPETTPEVTDEPTATPEVTAEITAEVTAEITDEPTMAATIPSPSATLTSTLLPPSPTTVVPTATFTATATIDFRLMPTATVGIPMAYLQGTATYQNHPNHNGITVYVLDSDGTLLSVAATDANGAFRIAVPTDQFYRLAADAPLHVMIEAGVWPGEALPELLLIGGDINGNECVGPSDIHLLKQFYGQADSPATDINGDGITDTADLAILTGNYDSACEAPPATPTPTMTLTATSAPEQTDQPPSGTLVPEQTEQPPTGTLVPSPTAPSSATVEPTTTDLSTNTPTAVTPTDTPSPTVVTPTPSATEPPPEMTEEAA